MLVNGRSHKLFDSPVFKTDAFLSFVDEMRSTLQTAPENDPINTSLDTLLPGVKTMLLNLQDAIDSQRAVTAQAQACLDQKVDRLLEFADAAASFQDIVQAAFTAGIEAAARTRTSVPGRAAMRTTMPTMTTTTIPTMAAATTTTTTTTTTTATTTTAAATATTETTEQQQQQATPLQRLLTVAEVRAAAAASDDSYKPTSSHTTATSVWDRWKANGVFALEEQEKNKKVKKWRAHYKGKPGIQKAFSREKKVVDFVVAIMEKRQVSEQVALATVDALFDGKAFSTFVDKVVTRIMKNNDEMKAVALVNPGQSAASV